MLLAAAAGALLLWHWQSGSQAQAEPSDGEEETEDGDVYYNGAWYVENSNLETILLIGIDKFEDDLDQYGYINSQQADFLLLLIFDRESGDCTALQINRDIMTEITVLGVTGDQAGTVTAQLALAHTYGSGGSDSCVNTVKAVSNLLYGVDVDHYAAVTMDAVPIINDLAGGVTLTVMDDLTLYDEALVEGEEITLTGDQALTYVRARFYIADGTNLHRMER
ncbi:MAG: LCP family protein [Oscillospiraceae bacterium]|nr:LCP family protein [Oscillospiraceae bacterium]